MWNSCTCNSVWREQRERVSVLSAYFVEKFVKFSDWKSLSKLYGVTAPLDMVRQQQHRFVWRTLLTMRNKCPENTLRELHFIFPEDCQAIISKYQILSEKCIDDFAL